MMRTDTFWGAWPQADHGVLDRFVVYVSKEHITFIFSVKE
jgi:hypothetical protein